ncbi:MAG TPA: dephospho-CoA kinase [Herpetosiphonaceae bacterium]|nr:dephospho-CoA kinase [Herpetosiphonaceae bacterium]
MSSRYPHLYLLGLTGNIGCGKSTVGRMLAERGAAVRDADQVTREVMRPGDPAYHAIVDAFGPTIRTAPGGPIDRTALGRIVFADQAKLRQLEQIVHPATRAQILRWLDDEETRAASSNRRPVAVLDAVKLIESGYPALCDAVWVVVCDPEEQVRRLVESRGMLPADARQRIAAQPPQAAKVATADIVIDNSGTPAETEAQVEAAWRAIQARL